MSDTSSRRWTRNFDVFNLGWEVGLRWRIQKLQHSWKLIFVLLATDQEFMWRRVGLGSVKVKTFSIARFSLDFHSVFNLTTATRIEIKKFERFDVEQRFISVGARKFCFKCGIWWKFPILYLKLNFQASTKVKKKLILKQALKLWKIEKFKYRQKKLFSIFFQSIIYEKEVSLIKANNLKICIFKWKLWLKIKIYQKEVRFEFQSSNLQQKSLRWSTRKVEGKGRFRSLGMSRK